MVLGKVLCFGPVVGVQLGAELGDFDKETLGERLGLAVGAGLGSELGERQIFRAVSSKPAQIASESLDE